MKQNPMPHLQRGERRPRAVGDSPSNTAGVQSLELGYCLSRSIDLLYSEPARQSCFIVKLSLRADHTHWWWTMGCQGITDLPSVLWPSV